MLKKIRVYCLLNGGLGNQLFQYFYSKSFSEKINAELIIDYSKVYYDNLRDPDIILLGLSGNFIKKSYINFLLYNYIERVSRVFKINLPFAYFHFENREFFYIDYFYLKDKKDIFISGYWQVYKYFHPLKVSDLFININSLLIKSPYYNILNNSVCVSVHVRRSDYINNKNSKIYNVLPKDYYSKSIDFFINRNYNSYFLIFSDDISWCKQNFNNDRFIFVDHSEFLNSNLLDFFTMMNCNSHIIANSTFSWWAAYLNPNPYKIVISPSYWINRDHNIDDIIPSNWLKYDSI